MRCYLAQHGAACCKEENPARPLSAQGREDIARVAGFLSLFTKPAPTAIHCSGKLRAQQSAAMFAEGWNTPAPCTSDDLDPKADPQRWFDRLDRSEEDLMLVGHLPHLSSLASSLLLGHGNGAP
ncbi:MAG: phosphohistidine phosphatase SixA, partial [Mariprofundales bacterium]